MKYVFFSSIIVLILFISSGCVDEKASRADFNIADNDVIIDYETLSDDNNLDKEFTDYNEADFMKIDYDEVYHELEVEIPEESEDIDVEIIVFDEIEEDIDFDNSSDIDNYEPLPGDIGGPYSHVRTDVSVVVKENVIDTKIPVHFFISTKSGNLPTIIFTHGYQLKPSFYYSYGEYLASWGYIVAFLEMPNSRVVGNPTDTHGEMADFMKKVVDWLETHADDITTATKGKVDMSRFGVSCHSIGCKLSVLMMNRDSNNRAKASFMVDPVDQQIPILGPESVTPELIPDITIPLAFIGETLDSADNGCAPASVNFKEFYKYATAPSIQIEVNDAGHMEFHDEPGCLACAVCKNGPTKHMEVKRLTRKYMKAFYDIFLLEMTDEKDHLTGSSMQEDVDTGIIVYETKNDF